MLDGYVKVFRKALERGWLKNHTLWTFWTYCLLRANHTETDAIVGYQTIRLKPGQFIFGRKKAAVDLNMSEQQIRTCIKFLHKVEQNITIETTNKYSIITIVNWHIYQGKEPSNNQQDNHQITNKQPSNNQQITIK